MSRGGWRYGAGRPGWHVKAEQCRRLEVGHLHRERLLRPGASCTWAWHADGEPLGSIGIGAEAGALSLTYTLNGAPVHQRVAIHRTPCNYGGSRPWFACPRCARRVGVLYLRSGFACRRCSRVVYASQSEDALGRTWRKQQRAEARLGERWQRPKGMHRTTYERLLNRIMECEQRRDDALCDFAVRHFPGLLN